MRDMMRGCMMGKSGSSMGLTNPEFAGRGINLRLVFGGTIRMGVFLYRFIGTVHIVRRTHGVCGRGMVDADRLDGGGIKRGDRR